MGLTPVHLQMEWLDPLLRSSFGHSHWKHTNCNAWCLHSHSRVQEGLYFRVHFYWRPFLDLELYCHRQLQCAHLCLDDYAHGRNLWRGQAHERWSKSRRSIVLVWLLGVGVSDLAYQQRIDNWKRGKTELNKNHHNIKHISSKCTVNRRHITPIAFNLCSVCTNLHATFSRHNEYVVWIKWLFGSEANASVFLPVLHGW